MRASSTVAGWLVALAACAPADPGWNAGHAADPEAPTGEEVPVAQVLREEPPAPQATEPTEEDGGAHHHHSPRADEEPAPHDAH